MDLNPREFSYLDLVGESCDMAFISNGISLESFLQNDSSVITEESDFITRSYIGQPEGVQCQVESQLEEPTQSSSQNVQTSDRVVTPPPKSPTSSESSGSLSPIVGFPIDKGGDPNPEDYNFLPMADEQQLLYEQAYKRCFANSPFASFDQYTFDEVVALRRRIRLRREMLDRREEKWRKKTKRNKICDDLETVKSDEKHSEYHELNKENIEQEMQNVDNLNKESEVVDGRSEVTVQLKESDTTVQIADFLEDKVTNIRLETKSGESESNETPVVRLDPHLEVQCDEDPNNLDTFRNYQEAFLETWSVPLTINISPGDAHVKSDFSSEPFLLNASEGWDDPFKVEEFEEALNVSDVDGERLVASFEEALKTVPEFSNFSSICSPKVKDVYEASMGFPTRFDSNIFDLAPLFPIEESPSTFPSVPYSVIPKDNKFQSETKVGKRSRKRKDDLAHSRRTYCLESNCLGKKGGEDDGDVITMEFEEDEQSRTSESILTSGRVRPTKKRKIERKPKGKAKPQNKEIKDSIILMEKPSFEEDSDFSKFDMVNKPIGFLTAAGKEVSVSNSSIVAAKVMLDSYPSESVPSDTDFNIQRPLRQSESLPGPSHNRKPLDYGKPNKVVSGDQCFKTLQSTRRPGLPVGFKTIHPGKKNFGVSQVFKPPFRRLVGANECRKATSSVSSDKGPKASTRQNFKEEFEESITAILKDEEREGSWSGMS